MKSRDQFFWGAIGALMPESVRWYKIITGISSVSLSGNLFLYISVLVALCIFAGFWSRAWEPDLKWKAIYLGLSFPTVISAIARI